MSKDSIRNKIKKLQEESGVLIVRGHKLKVGGEKITIGGEQLRFTKFVKILSKNIKVKWVERISQNGNYAELGEDDCFKFEKEISNFGLKKKYFVKEYFFDNGKINRL